MGALTLGTSLPRALRDARDGIPEAALAAARLHLLDALAVGLAASRVGPVTGLPSVAARQGSGPCTVLGCDATAPAPIAALINGGLIHSLEYDDTHVASVVHGSAVVAPAALAVAEEVGASGRELLAAFAVGWEFLVRIGLASPGRIQAQGFQITSAAGAFAAAAVSCLLHDDDDDVMANAIGIAGSQAAGTFAFLADGDTVKAVQPAWAAHAGLLAAELARAGVSGPAGVFDGPFGFFTLYAKDPDGGTRLARELGDLGQVWHLPEAAFKLQPCCHYIHPFIEALQDALARGLTTDTLTTLHCHVPAEVVPVIAEPWADRQSPVTTHAARWSLPYTLAAVLRDGALGVEVFSGEPDERLIATARRMTVEPWTGSGFPTRFPARLQATLADGSTLEESVDDVLGSSTRPVTTEHVLAKVERNLATGGRGSTSAAALVHELLTAPDPDLRLIGDLLRSPCTTK